MAVLVFVANMFFMSANVFAQDTAKGPDSKPVNPNGIVVNDIPNPRCQSRRADQNFTSIQAAVIASPAGSTIQVCPGLYQEQVRIDKPLTVVGVKADENGDGILENAAIVKPNGVVPNSASVFSAFPIAAIILVDAAAKVDLENLTVDGISNGIAGCTPDLVGIYYRNSSGRVESVAVRNIKLGTGLEGCQSGQAIAVDTGAGFQSKVDILNSSVHDYQKTGILANELGTDVVVKGNAITGIGPTPAISQNGIQIGFGAKARIEDNSIINHIYALCTQPSDPPCQESATNIILFDVSNVRVHRNNLGKSQTNILLFGNSNEVKSNVIFDSDVWDGVAIFGDKNDVSGNSIFNSDEAGVYVDGNQNKVVGNTINEAPIGILEAGASSDNNYSANRFFNVGEEYVPAVQSLSSAATTSITSLSKAVAPAAKRARATRR